MYYLLVLEFAKCFVGCDVEGLHNVIWAIVSAELVNLRSEIKTKLRVWKKIKTQSFKYSKHLSSYLSSVS